MDSFPIRMLGVNRAHHYSLNNNITNSRYCLTFDTEQLVHQGGDRDSNRGWGRDDRGDRGDRNGGHHRDRDNQGWGRHQNHRGWY